MKYYFLHLPLEIDRAKNERFVIETEELPRLGYKFSGRVVARGKKATHPINYFSHNWCNPLDDVAKGWQPSFIPIARHRVLEMFDFTTIEE